MFASHTTHHRRIKPDGPSSHPHHWGLQQNKQVLRVYVDTVAQQFSPWRQISVAADCKSNYCSGNCFPCCHPAVGKLDHCWILLFTLPSFYVLFSLHCICTFFVVVVFFALWIIYSLKLFFLYLCIWVHHNIIHKTLYQTFVFKLKSIIKNQAMMTVKFNKS